MLNTVRIYWADVSSVSPLSEQRKKLWRRVNARNVTENLLGVLNISTSTFSWYNSLLHTHSCLLHMLSVPLGIVVLFFDEASMAQLRFTFVFHQIRCECRRHDSVPQPGNILQWHSPAFSSETQPRLLHKETNTGECQFVNKELSWTITRAICYWYQTPWVDRKYSKATTLLATSVFSSCKESA